MNEKKVSVAISFLMCMLLLTGCAGTVSKQQNQEKFEEPQYKWGEITGQTINIWGDKDDINRIYLQENFQRYEKMTGNDIVIRELSKHEIDVELPLAMKTEGAECPDILIGHGGTSLENLDPNENFYDFSKAEWVNDLTDTAINQTVYNGQIIGLPQGEASVSGTLYNKELFKIYELSIPRTQAEFLAVCEVLLQNGITPVYLPYAEISMLLYQFPMDSIVQDQDVLDALNNGSLTYAEIPEMKKIVEWYKTMADRGYFGTDYTSNNWDGMNDAMDSGKYAMMLCWDTWLYTSFDGDRSKFGLMPAFMGVPDAGCFEGPNVMMLIVNSKSPNLAAALDFVNFSADPYIYNQSLAGLFTAPIFINQHGSISTPQYVEAERLIEQHFYDSTAWLRVEGFSQVDAVYIQRHMLDKDYSAIECLQDMDAVRMERLGTILQ